MAGPLSCWVNRLLARRRRREERSEFLAEYFSGEISDDEGVARGEGITSEEMSRLRRKFED